MKITNTKTGKDVTRYAIQLLEGKINQKQFEELCGLNTPEEKSNKKA